VWVFHQSSGILEHNGQRVSSGYSGVRVAGLNLAQALAYFGPVPGGLYAFERNGFSSIETVQKKGLHAMPYVLTLTPVGHNAQGRSGFLVHGDYRDRQMRGTASDGCIILPKDVRRSMWESADHLLWVGA
jgi:hypothetical protein